MEKIGQRRIDSDSANVAYLAGFCDGEGCFRWSTGRKGTNGGTQRVCIVNTFLPILQCFKQRFGGAVIEKTARRNKNPKWRRCYEWYCTGTKARNCIRVLLPYLFEKQEQARILLMISDVHPMYRKKFIKHLSKLKRIESSL